MPTLDKTMNGPKPGKSAPQEKDRKHLTGREVERLIEAAQGSRNEARDRCLLLLMFRDGLRVSEAAGLKLDQVDIESRVLHVAVAIAVLDVKGPADRMHPQNDRDTVYPREASDIAEADFAHSPTPLGICSTYWSFY